MKRMVCIQQGRPFLITFKELGRSLVNGLHVSLLQISAVVLLFCCR